MATITITPGNSFTATETVTSTKLNDLGSPTAALDAGTIVNADVSATADISGSKLADATVTKAKIENVADYKVLGNVSGAAAAPQEVAILDEDDMVSNSDTALATQQSIKTYVDATAGNFTPSTYAGEESVTLPNGLIMKFGSKSVSGDSTASVSFAENFSTAIVQVQLTYRSTIPLNNDAGLSATSQSVSGFTLHSGASNTQTISWMAIGY